MRGVNRVIIVGTLGRDPELKYTANSTPVCQLALATNESWTDKAGAKQERTEWHKVILWNRLAEVAAQYLKKGSSCYIEGKLQTRKWQDQSGQDRYTTEIIVDNMQMLGSNGQRNEAPIPDEPEQMPRGAQPATPSAPAAAAAPQFDDDIPF